ncbi:MAG: heterodisulfide reductase-related iron-sulfur binding cluster [Armatimonadota bacterium]|nr:heterodisulfide reductase-related iron-sulfur binding cluster [Armatimonadota bacterium]MDR7450489.1 heterodisulfide reductase-related iron-sulfur binding cluster [Armatimonadota bacterium]MDR7466377.1 heterodisulfide reductase-related iron-sulfur binding cluster [Armatimonadota bacterium]MDR7493099.1 heterodisulfide reductase-related iron-sulfur binding cluster [Armatimonadota bacterium]MDR7498144.1 heterodisulfide reductase-related iron-sulfur binding cluster [Armatimonadota bacterium]
MTPVRETFWNVPPWAELTQYVLGALTVLVFAVGVFWRARRWRLGRAERLSGTLWDRLRAVVLYALAQLRILADYLSGIMHLALFWGMVVLFLGTVLATVDWDVTRLFWDLRLLQGRVYLIYELVLDLFGALVVFGLGIALWRRYLRPTPRLASAAVPTFRWDEAYLPVMLLVIVLSGFAVEGLRLGADPPPWRMWSPVGSALAEAFGESSPQTLRTVHTGLWAAHALLAFIFIASIPFTKAFHLISSPLNVFFRDFSPPGTLRPAAAAGAASIRDLTWKQLLELDACTWCGRCQEVCPAYASGLPLSPKHLMMKLDAALLRTGGRQRNPGEDGLLHGPVVTSGELWACTTCGACAEACPVFIRQPQIIVDLRRHLVSRGTMDGMLQTALTHLARYGNSLGQSERARARWTQALGFPIKDARREPVEFLWFTGDYAAYDPRAQEITRITARLFHAAGVEFGLLFEGERNAGNDVRRVGEEGLFELLAERNRQALSRARFRRIVTTDPHTYHALKVDYDLEGTAGDGHPTEVLHYSELLDRLIAEGRLPVRRRLSLTVTYHDPCYLGRYAGVYEPPRRVLRALGVHLVEMPRHRERSFCCGAGGGRIWMEEMPATKERPAEQRVREAAALPGVSALVVACPKDLVMFRDAVKTTGLEGRLAIRDLAELVSEAVTAEEASHAA